MRGSGQSNGRGQTGRRSIELRTLINADSLAKTRTLDDQATLFIFNGTNDRRKVNFLHKAIYRTIYRCLLFIFQNAMSDNVSLDE